MNSGLCGLNEVGEEEVAAVIALQTRRELCARGFRGCGLALSL